MTRRMRSLAAGVARVLGAAALAAGTANAALIPGPDGLIPDLFGSSGNYLMSAVPVGSCTGHAGQACTSTDTCLALFPADTTTTCTGYTGGIHKFVNGLPGVAGVTTAWGSPGTPGVNDLNQTMPLAVPDRTLYPYSGPLTTGAPAHDDYYEIAFVDHTQQLHSDIAATRLRGFVQLETTGIAGTAGCTGHYPLGTRGGVSYYGCTAPQYMGPVFVAQRDVRCASST
jgi:hypothetical protein